MHNNLIIKTKQQEMYALTSNDDTIMCMSANRGVNFWQFNDSIEVFDVNKYQMTYVENNNIYVCGTYINDKNKIEVGTKTLLKEGVQNVSSISIDETGNIIAIADQKVLRYGYDNGKFYNFSEIEVPGTNVNILRQYKYATVIYNEE